MSAHPFQVARSVIQRAVADKAFPAAVIEVGDRTRPLWREAFGALTFAADAPATTDDTVFDLASLTKVLVTTPLVMVDVERGTMGLDDDLSRHVPLWRADTIDRPTVRDLLAHCSGLPGHLPFFRDHRGREAFEDAICSTPLEYPPRSRSIYSDLGFMLLGFVLERTVPLDVRFEALKALTRSVEDLQFRPPLAWLQRVAPTQFDPWRGRLLTGEVDDENASALGGAAGHAGLFGTAAAVGNEARHLLQVLEGRAGAFHSDTLRAFVTKREEIPESSRALGWDTMLPTSSCGTRMSARAFGHTGFTGTSLWIDPERAIYVVLLTNRVYPDRKNDAISRIRPAVHDAVMASMDG